MSHIAYYSAQRDMWFCTQCHDAVSRHHGDMGCTQEHYEDPCMCMQNGDLLLADVKTQREALPK